MTSTIAPPPSIPVGPRPAFRPATFADVMRSEWTKLRTVRSTYWALIVAAILGIGLGALISAVSANHHQLLLAIPFAPAAAAHPPP